MINIIDVVNAILLIRLIDIMYILVIINSQHFTYNNNLFST